MIAALAGTAPHWSEPRAVTISAQPAWNRKGIPVTLALLAAWLLVLPKLKSLASPVPDPVSIVIHRLRKRFRELVKTEIAQTVGDPGQVQDELRYLLDVLCRSG